jgi:hypothetical protein
MVAALAVLILLCPQVTVQDIDRIFGQADKLLDDAKAAYEDAREKAAPAGFVDAGFKLEEARIKYLALQEFATGEKQKAAVDRLRAVNQLSKLIHDGRVAVTGTPAEPGPAKPAADSNAKDPAPPVLAGPPIDVMKRAAIPEAARQRETEKQIKDLFKEQYAKKTPGDRKQLARLLLDQAAKSQADPVALWVLCRETQDIAVQGGDPVTALQAVDLAARVFDADTVAMKNEVLTGASKTAKTPEEFVALAGAQLAFIDELMLQDLYDLADKTATAALASAKKSNDAGLTARATSRAKEVAEAKSLYQSQKKTLETLAKNPDDPGANLEMGKFLCFVKGEWDLGARFLVKSGDTALKALAERELAFSVQSIERVALADGWWELADKEKSPLRKARLMARARAIYESALPDASALQRAKIEKRLNELSLPPFLSKGITFQTPDQMKLFVTSGGSWRIENGELLGTCSGDRNWATFRAWFTSINQVTFKARIVPVGPQHNLRVWVGPIHIIFNWEGADRDAYRNGLALTDKTPSSIKPGKEYEITLKQQGSKVVVSIDGKRMWDCDATMSGIVSIQGAHESTIGLRSLAIDGVADLSKPVTAENRQGP